MADVIRLETRALRTSRKQPADTSRPGNAVILMFTGIRYERLDAQTGSGPAKTPFQGATQKH